MPPQLPEHAHLLQTLPMQLIGSCPPLSQLSLVSQHITFTYIITSLSVHFPAGCANLVSAYPFLSFDPESPTTRLPAGMPLLSFMSPNYYLLGDDITLSFDFNLVVAVRSTWLKLHVVNPDAFPHTLSAIFTVQELEAP